MAGAVFLDNHFCSDAMSALPDKRSTDWSFKASETSIGAVVVTMMTMQVTVQVWGAFGLAGLLL